MSQSKSRRVFAAAVAVLAMGFGFAAGGRAHEGHHHDAKGTIKTISETKLELTGTDLAELSFVLSEATRFVRGTAQVKRDEVAVGERAVVMYEKKDGADRALEVKLAERKP